MIRKGIMKMKLKELRKQANMTQSQLSEKLGVTGQTVLNWENGVYEPKIEQLIKLADLFNVTIDYLVDRPTKISKADEICKELSKISVDDLYEFNKSKLS